MHLQLTDIFFIFRIIQNDQNAQMAFHIHKALGYALDVRLLLILKDFIYRFLIKFTFTTREYLIVNGFHCLVGVQETDRKGDPS